MGKKGGWLSAVKKALTPSDSSEKKNKKSGKKKSKKYWFGKQKSVDKDLSQTEPTLGDHVTLEPKNDQDKHVNSVAILNRSAEEIAAIKIQTVYRGHLARRALRALRGLTRLRSLVQGQSVKRQATSTLKCMQTLTRVQSQVRSRRVSMNEENKVVQQLLLKHEKELNNIRSSLGDTWDDSRKSKEEIEASLRRKQEAAVRRERALAYAHAHQQMWKNTAKSTNPTFLDSNNPHWGWSWLERWMASRPWETQSIPSTPPTRARSSSSRVRPESQMGSADGGESRSFCSVQSDQNRWHSVTSSVRDDKSVESSPVVPNYMASTESAKARSRMASPLHSPSPLGSGRKGSSEKGSVTGSGRKSSSEKGSVTGSTKKQLLFSGSPARGTTRITSH